MRDGWGRGFCPLSKDGCIVGCEWECYDCDGNFMCAVKLIAEKLGDGVEVEK